MIFIFGHEVTTTDDPQCRRSDTDHKKLVHEARVARQSINFNVEDSFVLCTRCGLALALKI